MLDTAFPFWAEHGPAPEGGFYERLDLSGRGIAGEPSRVRLQARMVFTFALAAQLGWDRDRSRALAERGIATLTRHCRRPDGLYGTTVEPGRGLIDDTAQAYDTAFALLAFATAAHAFGSDSALAAGRAVGAAIDGILRYEDRDRNEDANGEGGAVSGFRERLPAPAIRAQNPHMHLTEASLAWFEATGDRDAADRAASIAAFVQERFFDDERGLLLEYAGDEVEQNLVEEQNHVEAGHMFEWTWILGRMRDLTGTAPLGWMRALHEGGMSIIAGHDFFPLSQHADGRVREAKQRLWGPTEKLKGHMALHRIEPSPDGLERIAQTAEDMFADHIDGALPGAWNDALGPDKQPIANDITPASGYHVFLALRELADFASELESGRL